MWTGPTARLLSEGLRVVVVLCGPTKPSPRPSKLSMRGTASREPCCFCSIDAPDSITARSGAIFALASMSLSTSSGSGEVPQELWRLPHSAEAAVGFAVLFSAVSARERSWTTFWVTVVLVTVLLLPNPAGGEIAWAGVYVARAKPTDMQRANWRTSRWSLMSGMDLLVISESNLTE